MIFLKAKSCMQKIFDVYNNSRRATRLRPAFSECFEFRKTMQYAQFCDVIRCVFRTFRIFAKYAVSTFL